MGRITKAACFALTVASMQAGHAMAATCEESFQAIGDPRNGMRFTASRTVPGLSMTSALGQLRSMALAQGLQVSGDVITDGEGTLLMTQYAGVSVPVTTMAQVTPNGEVFVTLKLARGQQVEEGPLRTGLCAQSLDKLRPGKEGEAIAEAARKASRFDVPVVTTAQDLSGKLEKEAEALKRAIGRAPLRALFTGKGGADADEQLLPFASKYLGRRYRIDGAVYTIQPHRATDLTAVDYVVTQRKGLLGLRGSEDFNGGNFSVTCVLAADQRLLAGTLREGDMVTLLGTVQGISADAVLLGDCRQAR